MERILGFGAAWTAAWEGAAGVASSGDRRARVLGAAFNLGISLFDYVSDDLPDRAAFLLRVFTPDSLERLFAGDGAPPSKEPTSAFLLALTASLFRGVATLGPTRAAALEFRDVIARMYAAERRTSELRLDTTAPAPSLLRVLRRKSVLPIWTLVLLALMPHPVIVGDELPAWRRRACLAGEVQWIVDDLVDAGEDWRSHQWSRLWYRHVRAGGASTFPSQESAVAALVASGDVAAETARLLQTLRTLSADPLGAAPLRCAQLALDSWLAPTS